MIQPLSQKGLIRATTEPCHYAMLTFRLNKTADQHICFLRQRNPYSSWFPLVAYVLFRILEVQRKTNSALAQLPSATVATKKRTKLSSIFVCNPMFFSFDFTVSVLPGSVNLVTYVKGSDRGNLIPRSIISCRWRKQELRPLTKGSLPWTLQAQHSQRQ